MGEGMAAVKSQTVATMVKQPVLQISIDGTKKKFIGGKLVYQINVANKGDGVAANAVASVTIPRNARFEKATAGGLLSAGGDMIIWDLGALKPEAAKKLEFHLKGPEITKLAYKALIKADCAKDASDTEQTEIVGIPAILLEVIDEEDPIEVGANDVYVIKVTNQGSATGTNIKIVATLEPEMEYVKTEGATKAALRGNQVIMVPLAALAPKDKAEWRITVKALKPGDIRFKVTMTSDQLTRPVEETEATNLFED